MWAVDEYLMVEWVLGNALSHVFFSKEIILHMPLLRLSLYAAVFYSITIKELHAEIIDVVLGKWTSPG